MNRPKAGRLAGVGAKFKGNKYEKRRPKSAGSKLKKDTRTPGLLAIEDDELEQPDWQFLFQMFTNKRHQQRRTAVVAKQAPKLVEDSGLNLELNLFVAGLIVEYVDPWYNGKLNTDSTEFEQLLFNTISDVVGNIAARMSLESVDYLVMGEECCRTLRDHFGRLISRDPEYRFQFLLDMAHTGVVGEGNEEELFGRYLRANHAYFDDGNDGNTYLQILSLKLLGAIFPKENDIESSPLSSPLVSSFVAVLLGDLVLQKTLEVLASPEFLIRQIYNHLLPRLKTLRKENTLQTTGTQEKTASSFKDRVKGAYLRLYNVIIASSTTPSTVDLLRLNVFALADILTEFTQRQPLLGAAMLFCRGIVQSSTYMQLKVNAILMSYLETTVERLDVTGLACTIVSALREALFDFKKDPETGDNETLISVSDMIAEIAEVFTDMVPSAFYYEGETREDVRDFFKGRLEFLTYPELNKLVVLELLDLIVGLLYPELTDRKAAE